MEPTPNATESWLSHHTPRPEARVRLFCLPHAGGGASLFRTWAPHLAPDVEVLPVQLPGRENRLRETPLTEVPALVEQLVDVVRARQDKPFALFGHSMGALLAFELARALRRHGLPEPLHLFLASYTAPQLLTRTPPKARTHEADPEVVRALLTERGIPESMGEELKQLVLPSLLADTAVCESYQYTEEAPLECPVSAFRGSEDYVQEHHLEGWREQTRGPFTARSFLGDHFFLRDTPRGLLQALRRALASPAGSARAA
ncbi:thioesterase [Corallococcus praedator]|uniref:Thioesterase n=1 Tax=Corallococcus praedator TaxID=2316724 RepID=A0ABX9QT91_9BACT|nr:MULTISPECIES: alpha/beta fold hydrolase [Corallococcus]RKH21369.1 thioesterase [Corallococcus sp. CA047B]RKH35020.1 thioesterase [Corallococcus sp. CA031C]RKI17304.1 thioesterase [Corallococcus praedator]